MFSQLCLYFFMLSILNVSSFTEKTDKMNVPTHWLSVVDETSDINNSENRFLCDGMIMSIQPFENLKNKGNIVDFDDYYPGVVLFSDSKSDNEEALCKSYSSFFKVNLKKQSLSYTDLMSDFFEKGVTHA